MTSRCITIQGARFNTIQGAGVHASIQFKVLVCTLQYKYRNIANVCICDDGMLINGEQAHGIAGQRWAKANVHHTMARNYNVSTAFSLLKGATTMCVLPHTIR